MFRTIEPSFRMSTRFDLIFSMKSAVCLRVGIPVRRQAHELVLAAVHGESGVVREGRVEQSNGVRELHLLQYLDLFPAAVSNRRRGPFADAVNGEDCCFFETVKDKTRSPRATDGAPDSRSEPRLRRARRGCWSSIRLMNSFSLIQTGMAERKLRKPLGAKA